MDWSATYTCDWSLMRVNPATWADAGEAGAVLSAECDRTDSGTLESAEIRYDGGDFQSGWHRLVLRATQNGMTERFEVFTMLCEATGGEYDHGSNTLDVQCRSVLYPASVRLMGDGAYAPKGTDGARWAAELLQGCILAPVSVEGSFILGVHVVFDLEDTVLDAVWAVLGAGGFTLAIDGHGRVAVRPRPMQPSLLLDEAGASLLMPGIEHETDYSEIPNAYIAVDGAMRAVAVNDDPTSPVSTAARGFRHDMLDKSPKPVNGETLAGYARRRLAEESTVRETRKYRREYMPGVVPCSVVRGSLASVGLDGDLRIRRQSLEMEHGIEVTEEAVREVALWE